MPGFGGRAGAGVGDGAAAARDLLPLDGPVEIVSEEDFS